jgi:hypothetical protein
MHMHTHTHLHTHTGQRIHVARALDRRIHKGIAIYDMRDYSHPHLHLHLHLQTA